MINETQMTVVGNVVDNPRLRRTNNGHCVANFRLASTTRRFDREKGVWEDASTLFVNVSAWRAMAENVVQSVVKGQPLVVTGRYYQREYTKDEQPRTSYELEATALGHDLTRGVASFRRVSRPAVTERIELDESGIPVDPAAELSDVPDIPVDPAAVLSDPPEGFVEADLGTGEVRELATAG